MNLTLVVPALLWPRQIVRDTLFDADFPALQTLLGKGRRLKSGYLSADAWWCSFCRIDPQQFAAAPLRLAALNTDPGESTWLCADPVHLQVNQRGAALQDPAELELAASDATRLHGALAPLFAAVGELHMTTPRQWHLRINGNPPVFPARLHEQIEQSAAAFLPTGDQGRVWRQLINEVQMTLHDHPLNVARRESRQTDINSIALWGAGRLPPITPQAAGILHCDDLVIAGIGKVVGLQVVPMPAFFVPSPTDCVIYWDRLQVPTASRDALSWREALLDLENNWVAPALAALAEGSLTRIELQAFGEQESAAFSMTALNRFRFWRQPRRLESL